MRNRSSWRRWSSAHVSTMSARREKRCVRRTSLSCCRAPGRWRCSPMMITNEEEELRSALTFTESVVPERISADAEIVENGLAKLVLSIVELVRRLLEKQALRRMDGGNLSDEEIERLGNALMKLEEKMADLKRTFGLSDDELNLKLGPVKLWE